MVNIIVVARYFKKDKFKISNNLVAIGEVGVTHSFHCLNILPWLSKGTACLTDGSWPSPDLNLLPCGW